METYSAEDTIPMDLPRERTAKDLPRKKASVFVRMIVPETFLRIHWGKESRGPRAVLMTRDATCGPGLARTRLHSRDPPQLHIYVFGDRSILLTGSRHLHSCPKSILLSPSHVMYSAPILRSKEVRVGRFSTPDICKGLIEKKPISASEHPNSQLDGRMRSKIIRMFIVFGRFTSSPFHFFIHRKFCHVATPVAVALGVKKPTPAASSAPLGYSRGPAHRVTWYRPRPPPRQNGLPPSPPPRYLPAGTPRIRLVQGSRSATVDTGYIQPIRNGVTTPHSVYNTLYDVLFRVEI
ncbi:unnamed protein product [Nezara viridula]|uniref:Uncharacterized protein n=1 Tax=Nezara viridula TaxID=85310 RepID=A0A9P0MS65_NEZVI|nr:unnamed protein product [Nezara viridula]